METMTLNGGVLQEGTYPITRLLLRGWMIGEIVRSQAPNKVLLSISPRVDPAGQLLLRSHSSALSQLSSSN